MWKEGKKERRKGGREGGREEGGGMEGRSEGGKEGEKRKSSSFFHLLISSPSPPKNRSAVLPCTFLMLVEGNLSPKSET